MSAPRVKVRSVRMAVLRLGRPVEVENELVGREVNVAVKTLDAFSSGAVVTRRLKKPWESKRKNYNFTLQ